MNIKRSLDSRIRGWFPAEPYLVRKNINVTCENKQKPLVIPPNYTLSATKFAAVIAAIWIIGYSYPLLHISNFGFILSASQGAVWVATGLTFGGLSGLAYTKNQLRRLSKDHRISVTGKDMMLLSIPLFLFFVSGSLASWLLFAASTRVAILGGLSLAVYAWGLSIFVLRYFLFRSYERKENMRLMQGWFESGIVEIPKPPNRSEYSAGNLVVGRFKP